jgi:hypothetical protein
MTEEYAAPVASGSVDITLVRPRCRSNGIRASGSARSSTNLG